MKRSTVLALALLFAFAGCARKKEDQGTELSKNPAVALTQVNEAMKKASEAAKEAAEQKPVPVVKFDALLPFLPAPPSGWTADEAKGESSQGMGFAVSVARRSYRGPGEERMEVSITDSGFQPMILAGVTMASQLAHESSEGYERGVTLDGVPGVEHWRKDGSHAQLTLVAGKRFLVSIEASHVAEGFPKGIWQGMNRSGLVALK